MTKNYQQYEAEVELTKENRESRAKLSIYLNNINLRVEMDFNKKNARSGY